MEIPEGKMELALANGILTASLIMADFSDGTDFSEPRGICANKSAQQLTITAKGPGKSQPGIDTLFEPFQRGDNAPSYGIGLTIVKRLCGRFGWEIAVSGEPRKGSSFRPGFVVPQD